MADNLEAEMEKAEITIVDLGESIALQKKFLRVLQSELAGAMTLGALTRVRGSTTTFTVPYAVEEHIKKTKGLETEQWKNWLITQGAHRAESLKPDAYLSLLEQRASTQNGSSTPAAKISTAPGSKSTHWTDDDFPVDFDRDPDWHIGPQGVNAVAAWKMFWNRAKFKTPPWAKIRIAHIDTGYSEHAALGWHDGQSTTVDVASGHSYWLFDGPDARDDLKGPNGGHGTRISGAISGFFVEAPLKPYYGVAPRTAIIPYRVTDSVFIDHVKDKIAHAIDDAIFKKCSVINISLGGLAPLSQLSSAFDRAYDAGVIVVCAAGQGIPWVIYPGRYNRCITMGGVGPGLLPWASGATGKCVDLCAPADAIRRIRARAFPHGQTSADMYEAPDGDGTSYAAAACSGIAALWLAWHGFDKFEKKYGQDRWKIPRAFKVLAKQTATPGNWPQGSKRYGAGVINAAQLLAAELPDGNQLTKPALAGDAFDAED